eukprot:SAG11_NODE_5087_length_1668_cov_1.455704_2_plen_99_part_00
MGNGDRKAWSTFAQDAHDGHIWESLGYTGKPMDSGGGRYMGDTTSLYLLEMYEIYRHNGNKSFIEVRAVLALRCLRIQVDTQTQTHEVENRRRCVIWP